MRFERITALYVRSKRIIFVDAELSSFAISIYTCPYRKLVLLDKFVILLLHLKFGLLIFKRTCLRLKDFLLNA